MEKDKHIDLTYLLQIANGSNKFIDEMITLFMEQTPQAIHEMEEDLAKKDWKALRGVAHKMRPSLTFVGLKEVEETVKQVEANADAQKDLDKLPDMVARIKEICDAAAKELQEEKKKYT
jgi:HPt (histidine-containing phosphotransfer) domain-containing protein